MRWLIKSHRIWFYAFCKLNCLYFWRRWYKYTGMHRKYSVVQSESSCKINAEYGISLGQWDGSCKYRICNFTGSVGRLLQLQDMKFLLGQSDGSCKCSICNFTGSVGRQFHWVSRTAPANAGYAISLGQSDGSCTCRICNFNDSVGRLLHILLFNSISFILSMWYDDSDDDNDPVKTCTKTALWATVKVYLTEYG